MFNNKAQISVEMLLSITIIVVLFSFILLITINNRDDVKRSKEVIKLKKDCLKIANAITNVFASQPGSVVDIYTDYNVTILPAQSVVLVKDNEEVSCSYPLNLVKNITSKT